MTIVVGFQLGSSCDDKVSGFDNKVSESDDKVLESAS